MNNQTSSLSKLVLLCSILAFIPSAFAQVKAPEMLAETWVMTPKAGAGAELEKALKKHTAHRNKLEDPRDWQVFSQVLGNDLGSILVRSSGFTWADMDSYEAWSRDKNPQKHFNEYVDPAVSNYGHYLFTMDIANSHWPEGTEYNFVGVTTYVVKAGHYAAMKKDLKLMSDAAKSPDWPYNWLWYESVSDGDLSLAVPFNNYADMAPAEQTFREFLTKTMESKEKADELIGSWMSHFESTQYMVYRHRKDLMN